MKLCFSAPALWVTWGSHTLSIGMGPRVWSNFHQEPTFHLTWNTRRYADCLAVGPPTERQESLPAKTWGCWNKRSRNWHRIRWKAPSIVWKELHIVSTQARIEENGEDPLLIGNCMDLWVNRPAFSPAWALWCSVLLHPFSRIPVALAVVQHPFVLHCLWVYFHSTIEFWTFWKGLQRLQIPLLIWAALTSHWPESAGIISFLCKQRCKGKNTLDSTRSSDRWSSRAALRTCLWQDAAGARPSATYQ